METIVLLSLFIHKNSSFVCYVYSMTYSEHFLILCISRVVGRTKQKDSSFIRSVICNSPLIDIIQDNAIKHALTRNTLHF